MQTKLSNSRYDVIVVGAGNAALTAALSAHQNGSRVLILEKAPESLRGGNSRFSGALFRFSYDGIEDIKPLRPDVPQNEWELIDVGHYDTDAYFQDMLRITQGQTDKTLARKLADESYPTMVWMAELGVQWDWTSLWSMATGEGRRFNAGAVIQAKNKGVGLMDNLYSAMNRAGIDITYQSKMLSFLQDDKSSVVGVKVRTPSGVEDVRASAVVLASGGFEANAEMRARYLGPGWDQVKVRGSRFNTGETLRMALEIGANPVGHWQGCHATPVDGDSAPMGQLELTDLTNRLSYPYSIMVNDLGKRFMDEGEDLGGYTYAKTGANVLGQPGARAYQIFDSKTIGLIEKRYSTGTPIVGNTISEVAVKAGLPAEELMETISEFNLATQDGLFDPSKKDGLRTDGLHPDKSNWAQKVDSPPYTIYKVACGITFTYGGIQIDTSARVIDTEGNPIHGLFATGEITGQFFAHNYPGGAGLMRGAVFGRIAGLGASGNPNTESRI